MATRSQWDKDLIVLSGCEGAKLDPSIDGTTTAKGGIDATKPAPPARYSKRLSIPQDVMDRIRLTDFIDGGTIGRVRTAADRQDERITKSPHEPDLFTGARRIQEMLPAKEIWFKCLKCGQESYCDIYFDKIPEAEVMCPFCLHGMELNDVRIELK